MSVQSQSSDPDGSVEPPTDAKLDSDSRPKHPLAALVDALVQLRNGRSVDDVASQLDIPPAALGRWVSSLDALLPLDADAGMTQLEDDEIRRLRLENEYLRQQRDLYRKACGVVPPKSPPQRNEGNLG
jgi:transposase